MVPPPGAWQSRDQLRPLDAFLPSTSINENSNRTGKRAGGDRNSVAILALFVFSFVFLTSFRNVNGHSKLRRVVALRSEATLEAQ